MAMAQKLLNVLSADMGMRRQPLKESPPDHIRQKEGRMGQVFHRISDICAPVYPKLTRLQKFHICATVFPMLRRCTNGLKDFLVAAYQVRYQKTIDVGWWISSEVAATYGSLISTLAEELATNCRANSTLRRQTVHRSAFP